MDIANDYTLSIGVYCMRQRRELQSHQDTLADGPPPQQLCWQSNVSVVVSPCLVRRSPHAAYQCITEQFLCAVAICQCIIDHSFTPSWSFSDGNLVQASPGHASTSFHHWMINFSVCRNVDFCMSKCRFLYVEMSKWYTIWLNIIWLRLVSAILIYIVVFVHNSCSTDMDIANDYTLSIGVYCMPHKFVAPHAVREVVNDTLVLVFSDILIILWRQSRTGIARARIYIISSLD
jgi:hypothetical protein